MESEGASEISFWTYSLTVVTSLPIDPDAVGSVDALTLLVLIVRGATVISAAKSVGSS